MPNGTYGGVRGRKMKVGGNDYIIFLLLDCMFWLRKTFCLLYFIFFFVLE